MNNRQAGAMDPAPKVQRVAVILTAHREGVLAHQMLSSLQRCRDTAEASGVQVNFVVCTDCADVATIDAIRRHHELRSDDRIEILDFGDVGMARNHGIALTDAEWIGVCDADDLLSDDWITTALDVLHLDPGAIIHPEWVVFFGRSKGISRQIGCDHPVFDENVLLVANPWNSCAFASRETFTSVPYLATDPSRSGFGYEDWHWNAETLAAGHRHLVAPGVVHCVRRKKLGSMNGLHSAFDSLPRPSRFFDVWGER